MLSRMVIRFVPTRTALSDMTAVAARDVGGLGSVDARFMKDIVGNYIAVPYSIKDELVVDEKSGRYVSSSWCEHAINVP